MPSRLSVDRLVAPTGGMNLNTAPHLLPANQCQYLLNMVPRPGYVRVRGGIKRVGTASLMLGVNGVVPFRPEAYAIHLVGPQGVFCNATANTTTTVTLNNTNAPVGRGVVLGMDAYAATGFGHVVKYTNGPTATTDFGGVVLNNMPTVLGPILVVHQQRIVGFGNDNTTMFWTDVGGVPSDSLTYWQDDFTGILNQLPLPEPMMAAVSFQGQLIMWSSRRMYSLSGSSPATWALRLVADIGCRAEHAASTFGQNVAFFGDNGLYIFDGVSAPRLVSEPIGTQIRDFTRIDYRSGGWSTAEPVDDETLAVSVGVGTSPTANHFTGLYHLRYDAWTAVSNASSGGLFSGLFGWVLPPPGSNTVTTARGYRAWYWDGRAWLLDRVNSPELGGVDDDGTTLRAPSAKIVYRRLQPGGVLSKAQLHRIALDISPGPTSGANITVSDSAGGLINFPGPSLDVPSDAGQWMDFSFGGPYTKRLIYDIFQEVADIDLTLNLTTPPTALATYKAAVYDGYVEYQNTRDAPG